jgi:predicted nucleic acid-binding Zn ribbon protein
LFYNVRAALAAIVEAGAKKQPAAQISPTSSIVVTPLRGVKFMFPAPSTGTVAFIMPDGTLWFYQDPYRDFLAVIEGVEVTRLRRCPVCGRFFWAQREDKAACGARCANVYRVRRRREKQREYAANRRENRRVKKQRAKGRIFK